MIRVLLADDQALVRGGFRVILESQPDITVLGEAADGAEAIELARLHKPDVVLMDVRMPRLDGIEATRRLSRRHADPVLMLTTFDPDEYVYEAMRAGASGFLLKYSPPAQLAEPCASWQRGDALLSPEITRRLIAVLAPAARRRRSIHDGGAHEPGARRARAHGQGPSNAEVAGALFLSEATVKTHVTRVLSKLGVRDRVQAVICAYEAGLVQPGEAPAP